MATTQQSGYLTLAGRHLYVTAFTPAAAPRAAVLLHEAFGEEKKSAFRVMVRLARQLAAQGAAVVRYDPSGTGESSGDAAAATWEDWQAEALGMAQWTRERFGGVPWYAVGVRLGAFAALHAASHAGAAGVVLVEPVLSGEDCLRDLERRQLIKQAVTGADGADAAGSAERWARGDAADFGGIPVGARLAESLRREVLCQRLEGLPAVCPLQAIRVSGGSSFPPAWATLTARAAATPPGRAVVVRDKPFWGQIEYYESDAVLREVGAFLSAAGGLAAPPEGS